MTGDAVVVADQMRVVSQQFMWFQRHCTPTPCRIVIFLPAHRQVNKERFIKCQHQMNPAPALAACQPVMYSTRRRHWQPASASPQPCWPPAPGDDQGSGVRCKFYREVFCISIRLWRHELLGHVCRPQRLTSKELVKVSVKSKVWSSLPMSRRMVPISFTPPDRALR